MFPLVAPGKTASSAGFETDGKATLSSDAPRLREAADLVAASLIKNLQKMATSANAIDGRVRDVAWRDLAEVVGALSSSGVTSLINIAAIPCSLLVTLDEMLVYGLIDLLCGGNGSENPPATPRDATPIDQQFAQIAFTFLASAIEAEWADAGFTSASVGRPETLGPDVFGTRIAEVGCLDLTISIYGLAGTVRMVLPPEAIDRFKMSDAMDGLEAANDDDWSGRLRQEIGQTTVKLDAYLDGKDIDLASLASLRIGQIIPLPLDARARVSLVAQSQVLFRGEIGQADDHYSLRIEEVVLDTRMAAPIVAPVVRFQTPELLRA